MKVPKLLASTFSGLALLAALGCGPAPMNTQETQNPTQRAELCDELEGTLYDITPDTVRPIDEEVTSLVLIADTSGSMQGIKMSAAKNSLENTLTYLREQSASKRLEVGLVVFDGASAIYAAPIAPFDYETLSQAVNGLGAGGTTPLGKALALAKQGLDVQATGCENIMLFTDGNNQSGKNPLTVYAAMESAAQQGKALSANVYIIAFETPVEYFTPLANLGANVAEASGAKELRDIMLGNARRMLEDPNAQ